MPPHLTRSLIIVGPCMSPLVTHAIASQKLRELSGLVLCLGRFLNASSYKL